MNRYEMTYIINTALEETARKELIEKFTELIKLNGGEDVQVDESWGKRRLAYPINDLPEGYYVLTTFMASGAQNKEIQRNLEINDMILRYLIIKLLDKKQSVKPKPVRTPAPAPAPAPVSEPAAPPKAVEPAAPAPVKVAEPAKEPETKTEEPVKETADKTE